jgi:hypothetical protein
VYLKTNDQVVGAAARCTFGTSTFTSNGTSFGTMASTGVFTFSTAGTYIVTVNLNVTGTPDVWGRVNSTDTPKYMQLAGSVTKTTLSDVISVSVNDTFDLYINSALTVNGALSDTATKISFVKIN